MLYSILIVEGVIVVSEVILFIDAGFLSKLSKYLGEGDYNKIFKVQVLDNANLSPQYLACDMLGFSSSNWGVVYG